MLSLTNIRSFQLEAGLQMDMISRFLKAPLIRLFKFPHLRKVSISGILEVRMVVLLSWLDSNPSIKSISFMNCDLRYIVPPRNQKSKSASFRSLETLQLSPCVALHFSRMLSDLLATVSLHSLTTLIIADHNEEQQISTLEFGLVNEILRLAGELDFFQTGLWSVRLPSVPCDISHIKHLSIVGNGTSFPQCVRCWLPNFFGFQGSTDVGDQPKNDRLEYLDFSFFASFATIRPDIMTLKDTVYTIWPALSERTRLKQFKVTAYVDAPSVPPSAYVFTELLPKKDGYNVLVMARPESDFEYGIVADLDEPAGMTLEDLPPDTTEPDSP